MRARQSGRGLIAVDGLVSLDGTASRTPEVDQARQAREELRECREGLGAPPRSFAGKELAGYVEIPEPYWLVGHNHPQYAFYRHLLAVQEELLCRGRIVWGRIVQANRRLFKSGDGDHPATLLYSLDPAMDGHPDRLRAIAREVFAQKGEEQDNRARQTISDLLAEEREASARVPVPYSLAGTRQVYLTTGIVVRKHLPNGVLKSRVFPLVVRPERTTATMILPSRFWPRRLLSEWEG